MKTIRLTIDDATICKYEEYYFGKYPNRRSKPIKHPYHESINEWMIMKRAMMNSLKQRWKEFIVWFIEDQGYTNLRIEKCELIFTSYFGNNRRHDPDNSTPKFILDGLCDSGFIEDDDSKHILSLTLRCMVDVCHPRTEIMVRIPDHIGKKEKEKKGHGKNR